MTTGVTTQSRGPGLFAACFAAMASPCEVLVASASATQAQALGEIAAAEAWRIEAKYSRYRDDSVLGALNRSGGARMALDAETAALIGFAANCFRLSEGAFDITSGVLRRAWRFDASASLPSPELVAQLRTRIGFERLVWEPPWLTVPQGMELDFGGIGKEYAVDRALSLVAARHEGPVLVNFGGDLAANRAPDSGPWAVGVERPGSEGTARLLLEFTRGGLATSGDTRRSFVHEGERYGHILDVRTGAPVRGAPRSVTVAAASCVEAGLLATLAMLRGQGAEQFLDDQGARHWCLRDQIG